MLRVSRKTTVACPICKGRLERRGLRRCTSLALICQAFAKLAALYQEATGRPWEEGSDATPWIFPLAVRPGGCGERLDVRCGAPLSLAASSDGARHGDAMDGDGGAGDGDAIDAIDGDDGDVDGDDGDGDGDDGDGDDGDDGDDACDESRGDDEQFFGSGQLDFEELCELRQSNARIGEEIALLDELIRQQLDGDPLARPASPLTVLSSAQPALPTPLQSSLQPAAVQSSLQPVVQTPPQPALQLPATGRRRIVAPSSGDDFTPQSRRALDGRLPPGGLVAAGRRRTIVASEEAELASSLSSSSSSLEAPSYGRMAIAARDYSLAALCGVEAVATGSALSARSRGIAKQFGRAFGCQVSPTPTSGLTSHLVLGCGSDRIAKRTIKYLRAVLGGLWVVSEEWLSASLAAGRILPEADFEIFGDDHCALSFAPRRAHQARLAAAGGVGRDRFPLLGGVSFCLQGAFDAPSREDVILLISEGGGALLEAHPGARGEGLVVLLTGDGDEPRRAGRPRRGDAPGGDGYVVRTTAWLLDCVSAYQVLPAASREGGGAGSSTL